MFNLDNCEEIDTGTVAERKIRKSWITDCIPDAGSRPKRTSAALPSEGVGQWRTRSFTFSSSDDDTPDVPSNVLSLTTPVNAPTIASSPIAQDPAFLSVTAINTESITPSTIHVLDNTAPPACTVSLAPTSVLSTDQVLVNTVLAAIELVPTLTSAPEDLKTSISNPVNSISNRFAALAPVLPKSTAVATGANKSQSSSRVARSGNTAVTRVIKPKPLKKKTEAASTANLDNAPATIVKKKRSKDTQNSTIVNKEKSIASLRRKRISRLTETVLSITAADSAATLETCINNLLDISATLDDIQPRKPMPPNSVELAPGTATSDNTISVRASTIALKKLKANKPGDAMKAIQPKAQHLDITVPANEKALRDLYPDQSSSSFSGMYDLRNAFDSATYFSAAAALVPTIEELSAFVSALDGSTAHGYSYMSYQDIKDICKKGGLEAITSLRVVIKAIITNTLTKATIQRLSILRGIAFLKPNGKPRPIGIGEPLLQMASTLAARATRSILSLAIGPYEKGVGVAGGTEAMSHLVQCHLSSDLSHVAVKTDFSNAFGSYNRGNAITLIKDSCPALLPIVMLRYSGPVPVKFRIPSTGEYLEIMCTEGSIQGDPLSSGLFALLMSKALKRMRTTVPDVLSPNYLDDLVLVGPPERVNLALSIMVHDTSLHLGCKLNMAKSELYAHPDTPNEAALLSLFDRDRVAAEFQQSLENVSDEQAAIFADIMVPPLVRTGIIVAGCPVGTPAFITAFVQDKFLATTNTLHALEHLAASPEKLLSLQACHHILRLCILSQVNHLARSIAPENIRPHMQKLDKAVLDCYWRLFNLPHDPNSLDSKLSQQQACLPSSTGGLGIPQLAPHLEAAFVGSLTLVLHDMMKHIPMDSLASHPPPGLAQAISSADLIQVTNKDSSQPAFPSRTVDSFLLSVAAAPIRKMQGQLARKQKQGAFDRLIPLLSNERKPAFYSCCAPEAGAIWSANPTVFQNRVTDIELKIQAHIRLHIPIVWILEVTLLLSPVAIHHAQ
jgi:hypothetical protein